MTPKAFMFIGRSGSGKGTQAELLIQRLKELDASRDTLYIYTGQGFRDFMNGPSFTQHALKDILNTGGFAPEFLTVHMWSHMLIERYKGGNNLIFDGTPRKYHEAGALESVFGFYKFDKPYVIHLDISEETAMKRLLGRKRDDDTEANISNRLHWYRREATEAIKFYEGNDKYHLLHVDGEKSVEEIHADIVKRAGLQ